QSERGGLAGAGLRHADHVAALEQRGDRLLLDRGGGGEPQRVDGAAERLGQVQGVETVPGRGGRLCGSGGSVGTLRIGSVGGRGKVGHDVLQRWGKSARAGRRAGSVQETTGNGAGTDPQGRRSDRNSVYGRGPASDRATVARSLTLRGRLGRWRIARPIPPIRPHVKEFSCCAPISPASSARSTSDRPSPSPAGSAVVVTTAV